MTPESIHAAWLEVFRRADELDPIIREALRSVYDRLRAEAPEQASAFALAMLCRALRTIEPPPGSMLSREQIREGLASMAAAYVEANPDHP
jgi:hypothetical protein